VHLVDEEIEILRHTQTNVAHCPSSNLKLGSGIAPIAKLLANHISVSLGADGAPCNNRLDMFTEMRSAALLQKALHGPEVLPAKRVLRMATIDGARALGLEDDIGSLEKGKKADLSLVNLGQLHTAPRSEDVISSVVYSAQPSDVQSVVVDGRILMNNRRLLTFDEENVIEQANTQRVSLMRRAGLVA
jgi:cytosine/adenosine deaminase-related metal-dependent hydrolase